MSIKINDKEEKRLRDNISRGIVELIEQNNMTQKELSELLGVDASTVGKWINKKSLPRMGAIQQLSDYFKVDKSYFLEGDSREHYYLNDETRRIAQEAFENPELRILFNAARDVSPEDMKFVIEMVKKLKQNEKRE